jgi:hypothetical protein
MATTDGRQNNFGSGDKYKATNHRSVGLEELQGHQFVIGVPGQEQKFITTKRRVAEFVGREYGKEFYNLLEKGKEPAFDKPEKPKDDSAASLKEYEIDAKMVAEEERRHKKDKGRGFLVIMGQCHVTLYATKLSA